MISTLFQLILNTESRSNFGEGVLEIQTYETANLKVLNQQLLAELDAGLFASTDWGMLTPSAARRVIDTAVFDVLSLTAAEREAVYQGVNEHVRNRKAKAKSY